MNRNDINTKKAPKPVGSYPHSKKVGDFLFLSGIGSRNPKNNTVPDNFESECHSVFKNIRTVIEESHAKWENLVDITVFLTNMKKDFETFNSIYNQYFSDNQPCRTTIEIKSLPTPISIELKCIVYLGKI